MVESADYDDATAAAVAIGSTSLTGTGLAKESGGNLDTHTKLLGGTQAGALVANIGATIGQEVAAQIATGTPGGTPGGTPLLHGARQVYSSGAQVIAPSGTFTSPAITITRPGYLIRVTVSMSGTNAVQPTVSCDLSWRIGGSGGSVAAEELWYMIGGGNSSRRTAGRGPTKGDTVFLTFTNGDATDSATINVVMFETTQHVARDDWRCNDAAPSSGGATTAPHDINALVLWSETVTIGAGATIKRNLPLYSGQVNVFCGGGAAAGSTMSFLPQGDFGLSFVDPLLLLDLSAQFHTTTNINFPRAWVQVVTTNNGASGFLLLVNVTALELAS